MMQLVLLVLTAGACCFFATGLNKGPAKSLRCSDRERHTEVHQADPAGSLLLTQQYDRPQGH